MIDFDPNSPFNPMNQRRRFIERRNSISGNFDFMWKFAKVIIVCAFVFFFCYWGFIGFVAYKAVSTDWSGGIKPVIEKVWCGEPGCLDKK